MSSRIRLALGRLRRKLLLSDPEYLQWLTPNSDLIPIDQTEASDVFIAGYPKSGNTWMQNLIAGLVYGIDTRYLPDSLTQVLVPDVHHQTYYTRFLNICFFKSHHLPRPEYRRVIFLARDGRDVMASYYAMKKNLNEPIGLEEMIVEGAGLFPCHWHDHVRQWLENPFGADILQVRYEDLQHHTPREVARVLDFIGLDRDDGVISRAIAGCTFREMQRKEQTYGSSNAAWPKDKPFIRRGKIGSHRSEIPQDLIQHFEHDAGEYLEQLGYSRSS